MRMIWTGIAGKVKTAAAAIALTALLGLGVVLPATAQNAPGNGLMWDGYVTGIARPTHGGFWLACQDSEAVPNGAWAEGAPCVRVSWVNKKAGVVRKMSLTQLTRHWLGNPKANVSAVGALPAYIRRDRSKGGTDYTQSDNLVVIVYKRND